MNGPRQGWWRPRLATIEPLMLAVVLLATPVPRAMAASASDTAEGADPTAAAVARLNAGFPACQQRLQELATAAGVSAATVAAVLPELTPDPRVIGWDRKQPEFSSRFGDYFTRRVSRQRIDTGRTLLAKHLPLLREVQQASGVPAHYLVAFWGLETNFGSYFGKLDVPRSLATLACDDRRSDLFTAELLAALALIDAGDTSADAMQGSWAGAMGHVQFMPSVYQRWARDGDGDGVRDLWGSVPDAMASAGAFLAGLGWQGGERWGREVQLPEDFDHLLAHGADSRTVAAWATLGVRRADGSALPTSSQSARLLLPAGHRGPAFLVYRNFDVIMGWNRSEAYALAVGVLADRIAGAGPLVQQPPRGEPPLGRVLVQNMQERLTSLGHDAGEADGLFGPQTRRALAGWQHSVGRVADGYPDGATLRELGALAERPAGP